MHSWNYLLQLNVSSGYMYIPVFTSRFPIVIEHVPDRTLPFPISRNTDFVFPSDISVPDPVLDKKKCGCGNGLGSFPTVPDRFQP